MSTGGSAIICEETFYLRCPMGVMLSNDTSLGQNEVLRRADQKLGFIRRNLRGSPLKS